MKRTFYSLILFIFLSFLYLNSVSAAPQLVNTDYTTRENIVADIVLNPSSNVDTDRTNDIKNALNSCKNSNGGVVFLSSGIYKVSGTITIPRNCTLYGDYQNPDSSTTPNYGTIIVVDVNNVTYDSTNLEQTGLFKLSSGSGVVGLTVFYENQGFTTSTVKDQPWTFYYAHGNLDGKNMTIDSNGNITNPLFRPTLFTIKNVTMLNSYRGIGENVNEDIPVEMVEISNVKGTVLFKGVVLHNASESGTITDLKLTPDYWANMNKNALNSTDTLPTQNQLRSLMKSISGYGLYLTDAEMSQMANITLNGYKYCMYIPGTWDINEYGIYRRSMGSGVIYNLNLSDCTEGIHSSNNYFMHNYMGYQITKASISGSSYSIFHDADPNPNNQNINPAIKLRNTKLTGKTGGKSLILYYNSTNKKYEKFTYNASTGIPSDLQSNSGYPNLYISRTTKSTANNFIYLSSGSSADTIQTKLDELGSTGGGVLYLKPGLYNINKQINIPENTLLNGSSGVLSRQAGYPDTHEVIGTVVNIDPSLISSGNYASVIELAGNNSGVSGITFTYSKNIASMQNSTPTYTECAPTIGSHNTKGVYVTNVTIIGASMGIGFDNVEYFNIFDIASHTFNQFTYIKNSKYGLIKNTLGNPTVLSLNGLYTFNEGLFINLLNQSNGTLHYIHLDGSKNIETLNNFVYGAQSFMIIHNSSGLFVNNGLDSYGPISNTVTNDMFHFDNTTTSTVTMINSHRFNGNTGKIYGTVSGNTVNSVNTIPLRNNATDDTPKYENDLRASTGYTAVTSSQVLGYNTFNVLPNTNLVYNDNKNLTTITNIGSSTVYYSTKALTSSNYKTEGSTTPLKNTNINVGSKTIYYYSPASDNYYEKKGSVVVNITKRNLSSATVTLSSTSYTANNTERKPTPTVKLGDVTLVKDQDYTVSYQNNINPGTASVIISGKGNYSGTVTQTFTIVKTITSISVDTLPVKLSYIQNYDNLDLTGGKILITYSNATTSKIAMTNSQVTSSGFSNTSVGSKTITLKYQGKTTTFNVDIISKQIESISIKNLPSKLTYIRNYDDLDLSGGVITAKYTDASTSNVSMTNSNVSITGFDNSKPAGTSETLTVTYLGKTTTFSISIISKQVDGISMYKLPTKLSYIVNYEELDKTGGVVQLHYNDETTSTISLSSSSVHTSGFNNSQVTNSNKITVSYGNFTTSFNVSIVNKSVESISVDTLPRQTTYIKNYDDLDLTGGVLKIHYNDESTSSLSMKNSNVTVSGFSNTSVGTKTLTATYQGKSVVFNVEVVDKEVTGISVNKLPVKLDYYKGASSLDLTGGSILIKFSDESEQTLSMTSSKVAATGFNSSTIGANLITLSYSSTGTNPTTFTTSFNVNILSKQLIGISVYSEPNQTVYIHNYDNALDLTGGYLELSYTDGSSSRLSMKNSKVTTTPLDTSSVGTKNIEVTYNGLKTSFDVEVVNKEVVGISIDLLPSKLNYILNYENLDLTDGLIKLTFNDNSSSLISLNSDSVDVTGFDNTTLGEKTINVSFGDEVTSFKVNIIPSQVDGISIITLPTKLVYIEGYENLDLTGGIIRVHKTDETTYQVPLNNSDVSVSGFDNSVVGENPITVSYLGFTDTFNAHIVQKQIVKVEVYEMPTKTEYNLGTMIYDLTGGKLKLTYNDNSVSYVDMTNENVTIENFNSSVSGPINVTIKYANIPTTMTLNISPVKVTDNTNTSITDNPNACKFIDGKYYGKDGNEVSKADFDNECQINIDTGAFIPFSIILFTVASTVVITKALKTKRKLRKV